MLCISIQSADIIDVILSYIHFRCVVHDCGLINLTAPEFGQLIMTIESTLLDSVVSYTCDSGYTLVGVAMRTCTASGWSGTNPVCGKGLSY